jgi:polar amino acid transport system substrate-binding protein
MKKQIVIWILGLACIIGYGQDTVIKVGVEVEPPFVIRESGQSYSGLSVDLWKSIASEAGVNYEFIEYKDHLGLLRALDFREIDLIINPIHVNEIRLRMFEVTQPFYVSYIGVATTHVKKTQVLTFLQNFFSLQFFRIVALLILIIFIFGTLLWLVERDQNRRQFRPGLIGLFDGLWWSAVTMTTVGYGDKAPKTRLGRTIAIVWMLTAIVTISAFTASIASTLTVQSLGRNIEDLDDMRNSEKIGCVYASSSEAFLNNNDISAEVLYSDIEEALHALSARDIEVLVYDKTVLDYFISQLQLSNKVSLLQVSFNQQYRSFFLPRNSEHLSWINPLLVRKINQASWPELLKKYNLHAE